MTTPAPTALQQARKDLKEAIQEHVIEQCNAGSRRASAALRVDDAINHLILEAQLAVHRTKD